MDLCDFFFVVRFDLDSFAFSWFCVLGVGVGARSGFVRIFIVVCTGMGVLSGLGFCFFAFDWLLGCEVELFFLFFELEVRF